MPDSVTFGGKRSDGADVLALFYARPTARSFGDSKLKRPGGYAAMMSNALKIFRAAPLDFMRTHSVNADSQYTGGNERKAQSTFKPSGDQNNYQVQAVGGRQFAIETFNTDGIYSGLQGDKPGQESQRAGTRDKYFDTLLTIAKRKDKIAYAELERTASRSFNYDLHFYAEGQVAPDIQQDFLPIWMLPWKPDHVTEMKIPPVHQGGPSIFFTSALSGCSVFIDGSPTSPTICHAGTADRGGGAYAKRDPDSAKHWKILFDEFRPRARNVAEVTSRDYHVLDDKNDVVAEFKRRLEKKQSSVKVQNVLTQGTVFGIRDDASGRWSFYLQEKARIEYITFSLKKKFFGKSEQVASERQIVERPLCLIPIFPGRNQAVIWNKEPVFV